MAVEVLTDMSHPLDLADRESLLKSATTALNSKVVSQHASQLAPIAVDAVLRVVDPAKDTNVDLRDIKVIRMLGGTVEDTELVDGLVFTQKVAGSGGPHRVEKAKIGLIQFCISPPKTDFFHAIEVPGDSCLKPSTQRAFGSRKKRAWNKKAPATSAPLAAELESRPDPLDLPGTSTDDTVGPSSTNETLRVDAAYYSTAEQAQRVERSAQTKTVLSGKSATQRKFDLLGVSAECQTGDAGTDFLLVDMKVLNNFFAQAKCDKCDAKSLSVRKATDKEYGLAPQDEGYTDWLATHECQRNIECNSGRMEVEAALTMFQRSWAKHGLRYTTVLSDGDSRTFHALSEAEAYGFIQIDKKDCINHVHKRMGAALRNIVDKKKAQGESLGGRGKLTQEKIKKIANYYGYALRSNINDVPAMKRAPVFARLSDESLLARCCEGKTQNASESLHSVIWTQTSKNGNALLESVKRAAAEAVAIYNQGRRATNESIAASVASSTAAPRRGCRNLETARAHDDELPSADVAFDDLRAGGVLIPAEITLEGFADGDKDLELCAELTDDEIIHQVTEDSDDSDTENEEPAPTQPTSSELTRALMTLSLVYSGNMTLTEIEADIIAGKRTVQKKISDFFAPQC
ncbi:hypothetical protein HPB52_012439 [Rhipicephalus sanguineus]|uniref:Mutator-like transposase domain-containing protein n=1 Tax=Rhipicephalus sanguineus TaxID=34632 RepID=A0A9D4T4A8_RHISA|nr:hypothetical protein HPB52_012439 [Rhipicephalus sanguineus]